MDGDLSTLSTVAAEEEHRTAKISVWWDLNQCGLPEEYGSSEVRTAVDNIKSALAAMSYVGSVMIFAYGESERVAEVVEGALVDAGVKFCGVESAGACSNRILEDMLFWALDNPAPANYLLLSGDCDFAYALHRLVLRKYNILLALPEDASTCLVATAKSVWLWTSVLAGGPSLDNEEVFQIRECCCNRTRNSAPESESEQINQSAVFPSESGNDEFSNESNTCSSDFPTAPHEFFSQNMSDSSSSNSALSPAHSNSDSLRNWNESPTVHNFFPCFPHEFARHRKLNQNKLPITPNSAPDSFVQSDSPTPFPPMSNGPTVTLITGTNICSTEQQEISRHNSFFEENLNFEHSILGFSNYGSLGAPGYQEPSEYVQGLIGSVLLALHTLKTEKIIPTEDNITDCIRCGNLADQKTDVKTALGYAIEHGMVVSQTLGALVIYTGAKSAIWKCVNPLGGNQKDYPKAIWGKLQKYLSSPDGQYKMKISASRYEAATYLRRACLKNLDLGEVLQILNMIIEVEKWISVHQSGWQPISIALAVVTTDGDYQRCGAN